MDRRTVIRVACMVALTLLVPLAGGCSILGYAMAVAPRPPIAARYPGLAHQKVAVIVWADARLTFDYQTLGSDIRSNMANQIVNKMRVAQASQSKELEGTYFVEPRAVYRWQKNHPELEGKSVAEIAPRLAAETGATCVVYVEVAEFMTRDPRTEILLKGYSVANVHVAAYEAPDKPAYSEVGITANFPAKAPEGVPESETMTLEYVYRGLIDDLTTQVATRFFSVDGN